MKRMTVEELYDYLCSPQFLDEKSGNIFYNYYIYQYPASNEYEMRRQIQEFREKLERPTNFVNALELDLFNWMTLSKVTRHIQKWLLQN